MGHRGLKYFWLCNVRVGELGSFCGIDKIRDCETILCSHLCKERKGGPPRDVGQWSTTRASESAAAKAGA